MRTLLLIVASLHGLIHFMGLFKAYKWASLPELSLSVSQRMGVLWGITGMAFLIGAILVLLKKEGWVYFLGMAVVVSQILIIAAWKDAKFGTLANIIVVVLGILVYGAEAFQNRFEQDVQKTASASNATIELLHENDIAELPNPVQNYLRLTGIIGKPKVQSFYAEMQGTMRSEGEDWFHFTSQQYNALKPAARHFLMKARVKGIQTTGYHSYFDHQASMDIRLLSLFSVEKISGEALFKAETVTFLNDLCLFAPSNLLHPNLKWESINETTVKVIFNNQGVEVSAKLYFDEEGYLRNFVSNDRLDVNRHKTFRFSTPIHEFQEINGYRLPRTAEAIWHYPEGDFTYGTFEITSVTYNPNLEDLKSSD
ncbi:DUF6544 family protein [Luteirhabdus pelagi]|uniref:DUF6544 family protein n=1 Tax=Luteirhabdus pelagi TaxID=2792783 RepID=UPI001939ADED|nr:DUF6544 family protein [Luteirhabdus pelagi]